MTRNRCATDRSRPVPISITVVPAKRVSPPLDSGMRMGTCSRWASLLTILISAAYAIILLSIMPKPATKKFHEHDYSVPSQSQQPEKTQNRLGSRLHQRKQIKWIDTDHQHLLQTTREDAHDDDQNDTFRILYVVTTSGATLAKAGIPSDRWEGIIVPVLQQNIGSYFESGEDHDKGKSSQYQVDLYMISSYVPTQQQQAILRAALPSSVGIQYWSDANPFTYPCERFSDNPGSPVSTRYSRCVHWAAKGSGIKREKAKDIPGQKPDVRLREATVQLARQHRYVIKDKLEYYDFFVAIEDDMMFTKSHVETHRKVSSKIDILKAAAKEREKNFSYAPPSSDLWNTHIKYEHLKRMRPGFLRVEILQSHAGNCKQKELQNIKRNGRYWGMDENNGIIVPQPTVKNAIDSGGCCKVLSNTTQTFTNKADPLLDDVIIWETNFLGFKIRPWIPIDAHQSKAKDDTSGWFAASLSGVPAFPAYWVGDQITNESPDFYHSKKFAKLSKGLMAQQGGWMASSEQIMEYHTDLCATKVDFLPPFSPDKLLRDGLHHSVEYYSGGIQLWDYNVCAIQRVYDMDSTARFSDHLVYHASNNKQCRFRTLSKVPSSIKPDIDRVRETRLRDQKSVMEEPPKHSELYNSMANSADRLLQVRQLWNHLREARDGILQEYSERCKIYLEPLRVV